MLPIQGARCGPFAMAYIQEAAFLCRTSIRRTMACMIKPDARLRITFASLIALIVSVATHAEPEQADRPNIILFLVDDMGWQDTSVPFHSERTAFNGRYRTPAMEHLAARGVCFTNAYASAPVCTPTRTSIMTGQSPGRSHITFWTLHKDRDEFLSVPRISW